MAGAERVRERPEGARPGERLAAISGVALVLLMLLDWFGGANAWQLRFADLLLLAIAVLAIGLAASRVAGRAPAPDDTAAVALTAAGGVGVGVMLTLVLESVSYTHLTLPTIYSV